jgi:hypothetical protein
MPQGTQRGHNQGGRRYAHDRNTNDSIPIIGASLSVPSDLKDKYNETTSHDMGNDCRNDYRCRINRIIKYWEKECSDYYQVGVTDVNNADQNDITKYYFKGKYKEDIVYEGLNSNFVLYFLVNTKKKDGGKLKSWDDLRKYKDAIMWGAKTQEKQLPRTFYTTFDSFLKGYKKEFTAAKKKGNVDDHTSDPIPFTLYLLVLQWALDSNNILVWFWTLSQWNCMARSASIDPLHFGNFKLGLDSIIVKYDDSKADKNAERLAEKNIFANPNDWRLCYWTGLCVWVTLCGEEHFKNNTHLFLKRGVKFGTASSKYCEHLDAVVEPHSEEVSNHMEQTRFNAYGLRKGSSTYAIAGTTEPPSLVSIARRGEWSVGNVLDCYWHFGSVQDQYLGRVLCGLDSNSIEFDTLPPHWNMTNPMSNDYVRSGMELMFGRILEDHEEFVPVLLRSFACFVYHSTSLRQQMTTIPGHDFNNFSILHTPNSELLNQLRTLVTLDPTEGVMTIKTGIPPHINHTRDIREVIGIVKELRDSQQTQSDEIKKAIHDAFESRALESGHPTNESLQRLMAEIESRYNNTLDERLNRLAERFGGSSGRIRNDVTNDGRSSQAQARADDMLFSYGGQFYYVPHDFAFPTGASLKTALVFWFCGMDTSTNGKRIRPFRTLKLQLLPTTKLKNTYKINWCPIFRYLEKNVQVSLAQDFNSITNDDLKMYYDECIKVLGDRVSFCFNDRKNSALTWKVSTWSRSIQPSYITSKGSDRDKSFLDVATNRNNRRSFKRRKTTASDTVRHRQRQQRRIIASTSTTTTTNNNTSSNYNNRSHTNNSSSNNNNNNNNNSRGAQLRRRRAEFGRVNTDNERRRLQAEAEVAYQQQQLRDRNSSSSTTTGGNSNNNNNEEEATIPPTDVATAALESLSTADAIDKSRAGEIGKCDIGDCISHTVKLKKCFNYRNGCKKCVHDHCGYEHQLNDHDDELQHYCSTACKKDRKENPP